MVFHLAANADVRHGLEDPSRDLRQNTIATFTVLEAMRSRGVRRIVFSSTGSVYGEPPVHPTPEDCPFPVQTSLYGASKLAGEGLIQAYCEGYGFSGVLARFVSILGERYTHGHLFDFVQRLRDDPARLSVLGDGRQTKCYLYVGDCVAALAPPRRPSPRLRSTAYNLGTDEVTTVDRSVAAVVATSSSPGDRAHGRRARVDRRQPVDPPRLLAPARARLGAAADHRRGRGADARLVRRQPVGVRGARVSVVFAKAPLRLSLGGGGTDLPSYYREHGGFLVAGAIDQYVYLLTHTVFQRRYRLKYSAFEEVDDPAEIRHPILRETLTRHWRGSPLEIAAIADIPAGTGLGSSGTFTVCLLKSLAVAGHQPTTPAAIAEAACHIEIDVLGEPVGKQDQYVAAHGGICAYTFHPDDTVSVEPLRLDAPAIERMADHFLLFYTGETRSAGELLGDQDTRTRALDPEMLENLHRTKEMGLLSRDLLERGELDAYRASDARALAEQEEPLGRDELGSRDHLYESRAGTAPSAGSSSVRAAGVPARLLGGRRANAPRPRVGGVGRGALRLRFPGLCRIRELSSPRRDPCGWASSAAA